MASTAGSVRSFNALDAFSEVTETDIATDAPKSLSSIKARVLLVQRRRAEEGPPEPTDKWPYPPEGFWCKWCRRELRSTRNPLKGRESPFLEVSRKYAKDCLSCRNAQNWAYRGVSKVELEKRLKDEANFQKYLVVIFLWEDRWNNPSTAIFKVAEDIPQILSAKVEQEMSTAVESVLCLGVFWPLAMAKQKFGEPKKIDIVAHKHAGSAMKGVIKDACHGNPIGTFLLSQKCANTAKQTFLLADTSQSVRGMDEVKEIFAALQGRLHVTITKTTEEDAVADARLKMKTKVDDGLDDLWGDAPVSFGAAKSSGDGSKRAAAESDGQQPQQATPTPKKQKRDGSRREHELNLSEQAILKARHFLAHFNLAADVTSVPVKKWQTMLETIRGRLKQPLLDMYAVDYQKGPAPPEASGEEQRNGMAILGELRDLEGKLVESVKLMEVLGASGPLQLGEIREALSSSMAAGVVLGKGMVRQLWSCVLAEKFAEKDYQGFAACLAPDVDNIFPEAFRDQLTPEEKVELQEKILVSHLIKILQGDSNTDALRTCDLSGNKAEFKCTEHRPCATQQPTKRSATYSLWNYGANGNA